MKKIFKQISIESDNIADFDEKANSMIEIGWNILEGSYNKSLVEGETLLSQVMVWEDDKTIKMEFSEDNPVKRTEIIDENKIRVTKWESGKISLIKEGFLNEIDEHPWITEADEDGIKVYDGIYKKYYSNGKLEYTSHYKNGSVNGLFEGYYKNGDIGLKGIFKESFPWFEVKDLMTIISPTGEKYEGHHCYTEAGSGEYYYFSLAIAENLRRGYTEMIFYKNLFKNNPKDFIKNIPTFHCKVLDSKEVEGGMIADVYLTYFYGDKDKGYDWWDIHSESQFRIQYTNQADPYFKYNEKIDPVSIKILYKNKPFIKWYNIYEYKNSEGDSEFNFDGRLLFFDNEGMELIEVENLLLHRDGLKHYLLETPKFHRENYNTKKSINWKWKQNSRDYERGELTYEPIPKEDLKYHKGKGSQKISRFNTCHYIYSLKYYDSNNLIVYDGSGCQMRNDGKECYWNHTIDEIGFSAKDKPSEKVIRTFYLADELNIPKVEILNFLKDKKIDAHRARLLPVNEDIAKMIIEEFAKDSEQQLKLLEDKFSIHRKIVSNIKDSLVYKFLYDHQGYPLVTFDKIFNMMKSNYGIKYFSEKLYSILDSNQ